jgi:hypothetical protein
METLQSSSLDLKTKISIKVRGVDPQVFLFFTRMWLMCHCVGHWSIEDGPDTGHVSIGFQHTKDALHFKLVRN